MTKRFNSDQNYCLYFKGVPGKIINNFIICMTDEKMNLQEASVLHKDMQLKEDL